MKKIITIIAVIASIGLVAYTLASNKEEKEAEIASLQVKSESIPVKITKLKEEEINGKMSLNGTLEPIRELALLSETQGQVLRLVKEKGDRVSKGDLLLQVDNELFQAELLAAEAQFEKMKKDVARFENLIEEDAITQRDLEDAKLGLKKAEANYKAIRKRLNETYVKSPISGIIHDDAVEVGSFLTPGKKLYDIVDVSRLKLIVNVPESHILEVREGQEVVLSADVHPGKTFNGKVKTIAQKADKTLKYEVEIEVLNNNNELPLKAGMYAKANFEFQPKKSVVIDRKAIVGSLKEPAVFIVENGAAYQKNIVIGQIFDNKVEVIDGLSSSEEVVLSGQINLKNGTKVSAL
ncbi:efflux RND transporter periplasmic adaptor subunit [Marinigracilibium pacificum]|uniref:Efflux RND transporter periplasmic adaptor subunit n=1 Tax=Marinigracilibium pacificum TaxID=2729599 RepID=A0A848IWP3_9BACT|nr:efflux RND transporter periplasmic adaptor subunit [Marinigracilibium pacificum]NMM47588.1 efflux RND transporter periplasmic adaptor subunit [Marinigracilibium pacificum]